MKHFILIMWTLCWASPALSAVAYEVSKLPTGLEVISVESNKVPLVTIVLAVKAGGMTETKDIDGLTHLWEHMFFKGNKNLPNQEAFRKRIRQLGITYNGDTSAEKVRYFFTLPASFLEEGLKFMADAISSPLLEEEELKRERKVVMDEYDRSASQPGFDLRRLIKKMIYGDLAHLRDPLGQRSIIEKASRAQLLRIKKEVFVPSNSSILVSGAVTHKQLVPLVKKHFDHWKDGKDWKPIQPPPFQKFPKAENVVMTHPQARNVDITLIFPGPKARSQPEDSFAADVLISLLNNRTSKFYKDFIDSGISLGAGLGYYTQSQAGELSIYGTCSAKNAKTLEKMLAAAPKDWVKPGYFTATQLQDVRRSLLIDHKRELNKPSAYIKTLAFWWAVTGLDYYSGYVDSLRKTDLEQVKKFVKKYLLGKKPITMILTSPAEAKLAGYKDNSASFLKKYKISGAH